MLFADIVETSRRIAGTTKRLEKADLLATLLRRLTPEEVEIAVSFLSGATRQGRIGIGYATLRDALRDPASEATLELREVDRILSQIAAVQGAGSEQARRDLLNNLLGRATREEQQFLSGLLAGELRQGALEGIMLEGLAKASGVPAD